MSNTLDQVGPKAIQVAEVVHAGEAITLPSQWEVLPGGGIPQAIKILTDRLEYMDKVVTFHEAFDAAILDGAHALNVVLQRKYGWVSQQGASNQVNIAVGFNEKKSVPWGQFTIPGVEGSLACEHMHDDNGSCCFGIIAKVKRRFENTVREVFALVRQELRVNSIYRGKAFKVRFSGDEHSANAAVEFMDVSKIDRDSVVFSRDVFAAIEDSLLTPLERFDELEKNGLPVKRSVLLSGSYGMGKSLVMLLAARLATQSGITTIYISRASELGRAIEFARRYQDGGVLIECEDIDRELSGERTEEMDAILNLVDGIDTKHCKIMVVLTTNDIDSINPAMLRFGRLDAVIHVTPPDAEAAAKLVRLYGGDLIGEDVNLERVGRLMEGQMPAAITELVKLAKLSQLKFQPKGTPICYLSEQALVDTAARMKAQMDLVQARANAKNPPVPALEQAFSAVVAKAWNGQGEQLEKVAEDVKYIRQRY